ncbi:16S rRNA (cytosine(1402)-N(4))-methyltransferase RsmH [Salibacteraceae bacterium]|jgi:16S rRNA (cytosine1402-N4)-methyltransferase|nr:16S rRNA (cytosine(1402)-N(4))-methyltransferase RsmH [Salibacteraceae bacterium]MDB4104922.1 16S rRNA (cytosine(1402)-N(4))-methyltransferase RsmH [Salibacteraceae bacterium]HAQ71403.1 16S rRNA (cytosine(1402)-N(4))-methyltransferase [Flavobacteriales bacterium]
MTYHTTVLLHEGVDALDMQPAGTYVDVTLGAGGHSKEILKRLASEGHLLGFDQDADAVNNAPDDDRFELCFGNFRFLKQFLLAKGVQKVDGIIADLGVSGHHFDKASRGFSFRFDAPLDMRMNASQEKSAIEVVNDYEVGVLIRLFKRYGESSFAKPIARKIDQVRLGNAIRTTGDLVAIVESVVPERKVKGELAHIFQAIRIEVNDELLVLQEFLEQVPEVLNPGGKLVVLSYHSLEDRMVKHFLRSGNFDDVLDKDVFGNVHRPLDPKGKVIVPSEEEIESNPRARSAKMRIGVKR